MSKIGKWIDDHGDIVVPTFILGVGVFIGATIGIDIKGKLDRRIGADMIEAMINMGLIEPDVLSCWLLDAQDAGIVHRFEKIVDFKKVMLG